MRFFRLVWPHLWYDAACCGLRSGRRPFVVDPPASGRAGVAVVARGGGEGAGWGRDAAGRGGWWGGGGGCGGTRGGGGGGVGIATPRSGGGAAGGAGAPRRWR